MTRWLVPILAAVVLPHAVAEPPARKPAPLPFRMTTAPAHVSAAFELPDGRVLVSDVRTPAVLLINPVTGAATTLGSVGAGPDQYVRPGGLYGGTNGGALLLDRAQLRVTAISAAGAFTGTYSIAIQGTQSSSSGDYDIQRIDNRGFSYFADRAATSPPATGTSRPWFALLRFDPVKQQREKIADLRQPETMTITEGNMSRSQAVIGSPADGFGVAPDGRVAIVRGQPYRVEWIGVDAKVTRGPEIAYDPVPMTAADRAAHPTSAGRGPSMGAAGSGAAGSDAAGGTLSGFTPTFAATKAPFSPQEIVVSPDAHVWVPRSRAATSTVVTYDVFDARGQRVDRLEFPDRHRVVGFGAGSVYVRETGADGRIALKKYKVR